MIQALEKKARIVRFRWITSHLNSNNSTFNYQYSSRGSFGWILYPDLLRYFFNELLHLLFMFTGDGEGFAVEFSTFRNCIDEYATTEFGV